MWSFVGLKHNKQWIWLALDSDSREIVGMHVGSRDRADAEALWKSLPPVYRQCAVCYTDFWSAYEQVLPQNRHRAVAKESGKTNRIERFNLTLRQRISRLVRKTLSFSMGSSHDHYILSTTAELFDGFSTLSATGDRTDHKNQNIHKSVKLLALDPRILQLGKLFFNAACHAENSKFRFPLLSTLSLLRYNFIRARSDVVWLVSANARHTWVILIDQ